MWPHKVSLFSPPKCGWVKVLQLQTAASVSSLTSCFPNSPFYFPTVSLATPPEAWTRYPRKETDQARLLRV